MYIAKQIGIAVNGASNDDFETQTSKLASTLVDVSTLAKPAWMIQIDLVTAR